MKRLWLLVALPSLVACAGTTAVAPGATAPVKPNEGLVMLIVDTAEPLDSVTFYNDDHASEVRIPRAERGVSEWVFVAPAGKYRLVTYRGPHVMYDAAGTGQRGLCFTVEPGAIADPGQFQHRDTGEGIGEMQFVQHRWNANPDDTKARLEKRWPELAKKHELKPTTCR